MMKKMILLAAFLYGGIASAQKVKSDGTSSQAPVNNTPIVADTLPMRQIDGTTLHVIGFGTIFISYMETIDGYTIVRDRVGIFEYASLNKDGDLVPSGVKANDPANRTKRDLRLLKKTPQHLRYQGAKLQKLQEHEENFLKRPEKKKEDDKQKE